MKKIAIFLIFLLVLVFCTTLQAYDRDTLFYANFATDNVEDWSIVLGEWTIDEGHYCQLECSD